jgi:tetratricopeptide (TPR) repeat protein
MSNSAENPSPTGSQSAQNLTFGQLLEKHLFVWGTRPDNQPGEPKQQVWTKEEFSLALGVSERTVRNWITGRAVPAEIASIQRVLFGHNASFGEQREQLRAAHIAARTAGDPAPEIAPHLDEDHEAEPKPSWPPVGTGDSVPVVDAGLFRKRARVGFATFIASSIAGACVLVFFGYSYFERHFSGLEAKSEKGSQQTEHLTEQLKGVRQSLDNKEGQRSPGIAEPATRTPVQAPYPDNPDSTSGPRQGAAHPIRSGGLVASDVQSFLLPPIEPGSVTLGPFLPRSESALGSDRLTAESQKNLRELSERKKRRDEAARADQRRAGREFRKTAEHRAEAGDRKGAIGDYVLAIHNDAIISDYLGLGDLLYKGKEFAKAVTAYGGAINLDRHLAAALAARGDAYHEQHKPELVGLAEADYAEAIQANHDYAPGHNGLGILAFDARKYADAVKYYTAALDHDASFTIAYGNRGNAKYQLADYDGSIADCEKAIESVSSHTCLGNAYWKKQDFDKALAEYQHAEQLDPTDAWPTNGVGNVYTSLHNDAKASEQYKLAIRKNADLSLPYNGLGNLAYRAGNFQDAIGYFDQAIDKDNTFALGYSNRGNAYYAMNDRKAAWRDFETAVGLDDRLAEPYLGRAKIFALDEKWKLALAELDRFLSLEFTNYEAFSLRGFIRLMAGVEGSIDDFDAALKLNRNFGDAYAGRAEAYVKIHEFAKARADLKAVVDASPKSRFLTLAPISIHAQMNDYDAVIADCAPITPLAKESHISVMCGTAFAVRKNVAEATKWFAKVDPNENPELSHYAKAVRILLSHPENITEAIEELSEAVRAVSSNTLQESGIRQVRANLYALRGLQGDRELARQDYDRMVELSPIALNYKVRADFLLRMQDYKGAISDLEHVVRIAPMFADASRALGLAYYLDDPNGGSERALKNYSCALQNGPIAEDHYSKGMIYLRRSRFRAENASDLRLSIEEFDQALLLEPNFLEAYRERSEIHQIRGEQVEALRDLDAAVTADIDGITALGWRTNYFSAQGDYTRAVADVDKAVAIAGNSATLFSRKGVVYLEAGDMKSAIANFDAAIDGLRGNWQDRFNRGTAYVAIGQNLRAVQDFSDALKLKAGYADALRLRARTYFILQQYQRAVGDYESLGNMRPNDAEAKLMSYIARAKLETGPPNGERRASLDVLTDAGQIQPIVDLFRGQRSEAELPDAADNPSVGCANKVFVGEWHLLRSEKDAAKKSFSDAVRICRQQDAWSATAKAELTLLTSPWHRFWSKPLQILYSWSAAPT